jgi:hypothetical protein
MLRRQVLRLAAALGKSPYAPATQIDCCQMEYAYQWSPAHLASYPLFYDDPAVRARDFVLISCANATGDGGTCGNRVDGGSFHGSALITLAVPIVAGAPDDGAAAIIRYTLDGSDPAGPAAIAYATPIRITQTTQLRARKVGATGDAVVQSRNVSFVRMDHSRF